MMLLTSAASMERLFDLDWQLLSDSVITMISVLVLFFLLSFLLFNPARKMLKGRTERIKGELDQAAEDMEKAQSMKMEYEAKLQNIQAEADAIMAEARKRAIANETQIVNEAKEEAARILERARVEADLEKKKVADDVKKEVISVASLMAGKIVAASIDTDVQDSLIDETLKEMGDSTWLS